MTTDLDRLHRVVLERSKERRAGRTYAAAHNLAGLLETVEDGAMIVWVIPRWEWIRHIEVEIDRACREHMLLYRCASHHAYMVFERGIRLLFVTHDDHDRRMLGAGEVYYVDDLGECDDFLAFEAQRKVADDPRVFNERYGTWWEGEDAPPEPPPARRRRLYED